MANGSLYQNAGRLGCHISATDIKRKIFYAHIIRRFLPFQSVLCIKYVVY